MENVVGGRGAALPSGVARSIGSRVRTEHVIYGVVLLVVALLVVPPIIMLVRTSLVVGELLGHPGTLSLSGYTDILTSHDLPGLVGNTLIFAAGSTVTGMLLGTALAWCTERTNTPFKRLVYTATFVSFAVPGILRAIGWILLIGPGSGALNDVLRGLLHTDATFFNAFTTPAMIVVEGLFWVPVVFLMMAASMRSLDPSMEEAASMSGGSTWVALLRVTLPLTLPGLLSALLLTFIRAVQAFEVPLLLGVPGKIYSLSAEVYLSVHSGIVPDYSAASAYGVLLLVFLVGCLYVYGRVTTRASSYATITGKGFRPRVSNLGRGRILTGAFVLAVVALQLLPVAYLAYASLLGNLSSGSPFQQALTLSNYATVLQSPQTLLSLGDSLAIAFVSATLVVVIAAVAAWVLVRTRIRGRALLDQLIGLPLVFPGVVMGIAILVLYLRSPIPVYGTIWIFVIAYLTSFLPYGMRYAHPGMLQIHPELEESAHLSGAGWASTFRRVLGPLLLPALAAAWIFVFLLSLRELSVAALLYTATTPVLATTLLDLWQNGNLNQVAAFGALISILSIVVASAAYRLTGRRGLHV